MNDMKQPEALRLARELEGVYPVNIQDQEAAAAELRRLHELNDELLKAAIAARKLWGDYLPPGNSNAMKAMNMVDAAIANATKATTPAQRLQELGLLAPQLPKDENSAVVFTAPQGWGKTRDAKHLLKLFGLDRLVDDWMPGIPIQDRTLHLTNVPPDELVRLQLSCRVIANGWQGRAMPPKDEPAPWEIR